MATGVNCLKFKPKHFERWELLVITVLRPHIFNYVNALQNA